MVKKILLLNLPNREKITRRYMCSYISPESLLPPLELISIGAVARDWKDSEIMLLDAIAENASSKDIHDTIAQFGPNIIVSITGFECFQEDIDYLRDIRLEFPDPIVVLFGHYATHFPLETLKNSLADFVILGEPELIFSDLYDALYGTMEMDEVSGIARRIGDEVIIQGSGNRIPDPNALPMPAYDLLPEGSYHEPLLARPFGMIQTARGCPYQCNYCVKSYGTKLTALSPQRIVTEISEWKRLFSIKSIRFIDDTFTINRQRVVEICALMVKEQVNVEWACLSRTDNLDADLLARMKAAGCKRIYFGMESGSQRMLDLYHKSMDVSSAMQVLHLCRKAGIESAAFFMSGHPDETDTDFQLTLDFAIDARLNFASFNPLTPYPGTPLFNQLSNRIDFSIYPYRNQWKDPSIYDDFTVRKKRFYRRFYLRPGFVLWNLKNIPEHVGEVLSMGLGLMRYLAWDGKFVISGLKGAKDV